MIRPRTTRRAPEAFQAVARQHARDNGCKTGDVVFFGPPRNVWVVRLMLPDDDPRVRRGMLYEGVQLQEWVHPDPDDVAYPHHDPRQLDKLPRDARNRMLPAHVSMEPEHLGIEGLKFILQKGSLSRGEFRSMGEALAHVQDRDRRTRHKRYLKQKQRARDVAVATRRRVLDIPFIPVTENLT